MSFDSEICRVFNRICVAVELLILVQYDIMITGTCRVSDYRSISCASANHCYKCRYNGQSPCSMLVFKVKLQHQNDDNILKYHAIQRYSNTASSKALNRLKMTPQCLSCESFILKYHSWHSYSTLAWWIFTFQRIYIILIILFWSFPQVAPPSHTPQLPPTTRHRHRHNNPDYKWKQVRSSALQVADKTARERQWCHYFKDTFTS